jgi:hypothetical protein
VYDRRGRLIRSVTTREPEWTERDQAEVLALALYRASLCPCGCGHQVADTTSHEETGPAFAASRTACRARLAQLEAERAADGGKPSPNAAARLWTIQLLPRG